MRPQEKTKRRENELRNYYLLLRAKHGDNIMKITVSSEELEMLKDILERLTDTCTDEASDLVGYWQRKITRAENYHRAGLFKAKHLKYAKEAKEREIHNASFKAGLEAR